MFVLKIIISALCQLTGRQTWPIRGATHFWTDSMKRSKRLPGLRTQANPFWCSALLQPFNFSNDFLPTVGWSLSFIQRSKVVVEHFFHWPISLVTRVTTAGRKVLLSLSVYPVAYAPYHELLNETSSELTLKLIIRCRRASLLEQQLVRFGRWLTVTVTNTYVYSVSYSVPWWSSSWQEH